MPAMTERTTLSEVGVGNPAAWCIWLMATSRRVSVLVLRPTSSTSQVR
jgi:hypothetical protein